MPVAFNIYSIAYVSLSNAIPGPAYNAGGTLLVIQLYTVTSLPGNTAPHHLLLYTISF